jgi:ParB/RepB/Spo0J family partition protein
MSTTKIKVVFLRVSQLLTHPRNMRRFYPKDDVEQMARSIRARKGVLQALRVVRVKGKRGLYHVVDGNLRLAGARSLGRDCPMLKCEVVTETEARQMLDMVVANKVRADPDPISEALHYQALITESVTPEQIAEETGVHLTTINSRLLLLKLEPEIQDLIASDGLPRDRRVAEALLSIPRKTARIRLAKRLAELGTGITGIEAACRKYLEQASDRHSKKQLEARLDAPALELAQDDGALPPETEVLTWPEVRAAARSMCNACEVKTEELAEQIPEPAWAVITHAATDTCEVCSLPKLASICRGCPGVEIVRRMITAAKAKQEAHHGRSLAPAR